MADEQHPAGSDKRVIQEALKTQEIGTMRDGMSYQEAYKRASWWWDLVGRKRMKKVANTREVNRKSRMGGKGPSFIVSPDIEPEMVESGIMLGRPWDRLTMPEKARVTVVWHEEFIMRPLLDPKILPDV